MVVSPMSLQHLLKFWINPFLAGINALTEAKSEIQLYVWILYPEAFLRGSFIPDSSFGTSKFLLHFRESGVDGRLYTADCHLICKFAFHFRKKSLPSVLEYGKPAW